MNRLTFLVALLIAIFLIATQVNSMTRMDWCGERGENCYQERDAGSVVSTATSAASTLEDDEEVIMSFTETLGNHEKPKKRLYSYDPSSRTYTNQLGNKFECASNCATVFAPSACERCTYPLAFYNKTITELGKCFPTFYDLRELPVEKRQAAKDLCVVKGKCTCQSFEKLEYYLKTACQVKCKYFAPGLQFAIFLQKGAVSSCKKFVSRLQKVPYKREQIARYCKKSLFSIPDLIKKFDSKDIFKSRLFLNDKVLRPVGFRPNDEFAKALNTTFSKVTQTVNMFFDTKDKLLAKKRWTAEVSVGPKNVFISFSRVFVAQKKANNTNTSDIIANLLNRANNNGFNGLNKAAKNFKPSVTIFPEKVVISFNIDKVGIADKSDDVRKFAAIQKMRAYTEEAAIKKRTTMERFLSVLLKKHMPAFMYKVLKRNTKTMPLRVSKVTVLRKYLGKAYMNKRQSLKLYVSGNKRKRFATLALATYSNDQVNIRTSNIAKLLKPAWIVGDV